VTDNVDMNHRCYTTDQTHLLPILSRWKSFNLLYLQRHTIWTEEVYALPAAY